MAIDLRPAPSRSDSVHNSTVTTPVASPVPMVIGLVSALPRRVGVHIGTFGACSGFTRLTACQVARHLAVDFVARFRPGQLPNRTARQLSNLTINDSRGSFPPEPVPPVIRSL